MKEDDITFDLKFTKGKGGNTLVIVKFKDTKRFWKNDFTWCPTIREMEILEKTKVYMQDK
jgi:hypothetical protein